MMRPATGAASCPPCRTGSSLLHDAVGRRPRDAAGEGAGAPAVPNRVLAFVPTRSAVDLDAAGEGAGRRRPNRPRFCRRRRSTQYSDGYWQRVDAARRRARVHAGRRRRWSARRAEPGPRFCTTRSAVDLVPGWTAMSTLWFEPVGRGRRHVVLRYGVDDLRFTTTYWYDDVDFDGSSSATARPSCGRRVPPAGLRGQQGGQPGTDGDRPRPVRRFGHGGVLGAVGDDVPPRVGRLAVRERRRVPPAGPPAAGDALDARRATGARPEPRGQAVPVTHRPATDRAIASVRPIGSCCVAAARTAWPACSCSNAPASRTTRSSTPLGLRARRPPARRSSTSSSIGARRRTATAAGSSTTPMDAPLAAAYPELGIARIVAAETVSSYWTALPVALQHGFDRSRPRRHAQHRRAQPRLGR